MFKINTQAIRERIAKNGTITKREFDRLMVKGWKEQKIGYLKYRFRNDANTQMCAIGVVASQVGVHGYDLASRLPRINGDPILWDRITDESNCAGNKTRAIKAVKAIEW